MRRTRSFASRWPPEYFHFVAEELENRTVALVAFFGSGGASDAVSDGSGVGVDSSEPSCGVQVT